MAKLTKTDTELKEVSNTLLHYVFQQTSASRAYDTITRQTKLPPMVVSDFLSYNYKFVNDKQVKKITDFLATQKDSIA